MAPENSDNDEGMRFVEAVLNLAIKDGFRPYEQGQPDKAGSAVIEAARRLGVIDQDAIRSALESGRIKQDLSLYPEKEKDPHKGFIDSMRLAGIEVAAEPARRKIIRLTDETVQLRATLKDIDRYNLTTDEIREKIYGLSAAEPEVPGWVLTPRLPSGSPGVPMTAWGDIHYGEEISYAQMSGKNIYSIDVADKRIETLVDRIVDITKRHQVKPKYPGIIVCQVGDNFSGDGLHEELTDTNQGKTIELFPRLLGRLIWAYKQMADEFGMVYSPCVEGNHGRNTHKPRYKLRAETNYDFLLYTQLEYYFKNDRDYKDKVFFHVNRESGVHFTVGRDDENHRRGHRYYLVHGDVLGVKGGDGIIGSLGPIKRGSIKVKTSEASIGRDFDTLILGHWHQYIPMPGVIVNGPMKGWDEYARLALRAPYDPPSQALWFNHPIHGPVTHHKIILETPSDSVPAEDEHNVFSIENYVKKPLPPKARGKVLKIA